VQKVRAISRRGAAGAMVEGIEVAEVELHP
jgi:hypothetical protein